MVKANRLILGLTILLLTMSAIHITNFTIILHTESRTFIQKTYNSLVDQGQTGASRIRNITQRFVAELQRGNEVAIANLSAFEKFRNKFFGDLLVVDPPLNPPPIEPGMDDTGKVPLYIPKIIHQTYSSEKIPLFYANCIRTCLQMNPDWRYMFWSDQDARNFIRDEYPVFLSMFDKYSNKLLKADALRYFVLEYYGGLYMDMDMKCLRPIKAFLANESMVLVPEPHVQSMVLYNKFSIVTNAIMAAAPSHPFMSFVIDQLQRFQRKASVTDAIHITGPNMLQIVLEKYREEYPCTESRCHVFVADPMDLMPTVDSFVYKKVTSFIRKCKNESTFKSFDETRTCFWVNHSGYEAKLTGRAYTNHLWRHLGYRSRVYGRKMEIEDIVGTGKKVERYRRSP